jgi:hypothetical protein
VGKGLQKWSISFYGSYVRGTWRCRRGLWRWAPLSMGPRWEIWERAYMPGAYVWKKVLGWVSLDIGTPFGDLGRGIHLPGALRDG